MSLKYFLINCTHLYYMQQVQMKHDNPSFISHSINHKQKSEQYKFSDFQLINKSIRNRCELQGQKTVRIRYPPQILNQSDTYRRQETSKDSQVSIFLQEFRELQKQNILKSQALQKASSVIEAIQEQNRQLKIQVQSLKIQIQELSKQYEARIQKNESIIQNLMEKVQIPSHKKSRTTPLDISYSQLKSKSLKQSYTTPLAQIQKHLIVDQVTGLSLQLKNISQILQQENPIVEQFVRQNLSNVDLIEDEILSIGKSEFIQGFQADIKNCRSSSLSAIEDLNMHYQRTIKYWENYSNSLRVCLFQCLDFIKTMGQEMPESSERQQISRTLYSGSEYIDKTLIKIVLRDIFRIFEGKIQEIVSENIELKEIMDELINKISSQSNN